MTATARPVFVLGSLRSGASMLTWSLGQHPSLMSILDSGWLGTFAHGVEDSYAAAMRNRSISQLEITGVELEDFYAHFGEAINRLILTGVRQNDLSSGEDQGAGPSRSLPSSDTAPGPPGRWVDGSVANCFNVPGLVRLFPAAKFIHVLRDAEGVVEAMTNEEKKADYRSHWKTHTREAAYEHWLETVQACVRAEQAYGSAKVMRVRREDMIASPEQILCRCLDFICEPFHPACLRPFR